MNEQQSNNTENDVTTSSVPVEPTVESTSTPEPVIETNLGTEAGTSAKKVVIRNYAIATLMIILMGGGLWLVLESQGRVSTNYLGYFASRGPVATVNGVKIPRSAYEENRSQVEQSAVGQGADATDPAVVEQINTQAIETLINTELLKQEAEELNITVSDEDIETRRTAIVEQVGGEEALATRMAELSLTEETLRSDIADELLIQKLFAQEAGIADVEVTDEEVEQVFAQVSAQGGEEVVLDDETREVIVTNIRMSKEQTLVTEYIQELRAEAEVEVTL